MADINQSILDALSEGYAPQDIFDHFKNSDNPELKNWYSQYSANMADRDNEQAPAATGSRDEPNVSTLEYISNLSPYEKAVGAGTLIGGTAALTTAGYYGKRQIDVNAAVKEQALKNQLPLSEKDLEFKRQNDISQRRLDIEERRVMGELSSPELSPVEKIRLEREQLRLEADRQKLAYDEQVRQNNILKMAKQETGMAPVPEAKSAIPSAAQPFSVQDKPVNYSLNQPVAYAQQNLNAPTGAPNVAVAPPADVSAAPVAPALPTAEERAHQSWAAAEARKAEEHAKKMALLDAKAAVNSSQKSQGQPMNGLSNDANALVANASEGKMKADLAAATGVKPSNPMPIGGTNAPMPPNMMPVGEPPVVAAPVANAAPAPVATAPAAPVAPSPAKVAAAAAAAKTKTAPTEEKLTKEQKGMKNYLVSQYGGGPEGEGAYKKVIDILGEVPAFEKGQGGGLSLEANNTIKEWRKSNIEGPKVNLTHDMKKVMKGAGGAAILMALPGFAEAAQRKDVGKMSDIFTDFFVLPFAQSREAGMPKAQEEDIIAAKFKEASKLGSPYRSVPPPR